MLRYAPDDTNDNPGEVDEMRPFPERHKIHPLQNREAGIKTTLMGKVLGDDSFAHEESRLGKTTKRSTVDALRHATPECVPCDADFACPAR